jgi:hypothetical protein
VRQASDPPDRGLLARGSDNRGSIRGVRRKRQGGLRAAIAACVLGVAGPFACSSAEPLAGPGGACSLVTDCQDGLICCNGNKGSLTCVASVSCLQPAGPTGDAGNPTGMGQDDGAPGGDATMTTPPPGGDASQQGDDTGTPTEPPDTGTVKPPADSGKPEDTGSPQEEAAPPPVDSGGADASGD